MKEAETKERLIELRAEGLSFAKCAQQLKIAKQTAVDWAAQLEEQISAARAYRLEALLEQYCLSIEARVGLWGQLSTDIQAELDGRDLNELSTDKLIELLIKCQRELERAYVSPEFKTSKQQADSRDLRDTIQTLDGMIANLSN